MCADTTATSTRVDRLRSSLLVLSGAALFGTVGTAQLLGPEVPSPELAAVRLLASAALLLLVALGTAPAASLVVVLREAPTWWAGAGQAGFNLCFLGAMTQSGVSVGTLIAIGATPLLTGLATRHTSRTWLTATGIAVAGLTMLVVGQLDSHAGPTAPSAAGILLALGASASYATYIIAGNAAADRCHDLRSYLAVVFSIAALMTLPIAVLGNVRWVTDVEGLVLVGYMALVPTVLAYSLFNRGLAGVRSGTAATLGLIEPVVAALLAFALLGERLTAMGVVGALLIFAGLLIVVRVESGVAKATQKQENPAPVDT
ncbi:EamA family transporter [Nocardioides allogilvus]|uniref:EamA family transporter n=1 Tax=Nocardioides allogilvus TaxID=2072017 RepID=UPI000D2FC5EB|nr:DMT family transporter [Nocardioides allogilvus]